jgi:hypothetical protein
MDNSESKAISSSKNSAQEPGVKEEGVSVTSDESQSFQNSLQKDKSNEFISSSAAVVDPKDSLRMFIRTSDLRFNVKSVIRSTYRIEDIAKIFGGFVTKTTLNSHINNTTVIPVSKDSSLETVYYTVENAIELRVPAVKLDTTLKTISRLVEFLDYRIIQAEDVTLDLLSKKLEQMRLADYQERLRRAIAAKGKKLNETSNAEENLLNRQEKADNAKIANLSIMDQILFSTIKVNIYQRQTLKRELIANDQNTEAYEPGFWTKVTEALKGGWYLLESFLIFLIRLWGLFLFGLLVFILYRMNRDRFKKK